MPGTSPGIHTRRQRQNHPPPHLSDNRRLTSRPKGLGCLWPSLVRPLVPVAVSPPLMSKRRAQAPHRSPCCSLVLDVITLGFGEGSPKRQHFRCQSVPSVTTGLSKGSGVRQSWFGSETQRGSWGGGSLLLLDPLSWGHPPAQVCRGSPCGWFTLPDRRPFLLEMTVLPHQVTALACPPHLTTDPTPPHHAWTPCGGMVEAVGHPTPI